jgi:hypothetical protein
MERQHPKILEGTILSTIVKDMVIVRAQGTRPTRAQTKLYLAVEDLSTLTKQISMQTFSTTSKCNSYPKPLKARTPTILPK